MPRSIAGTIPQLSLLQALDLPVDGNAALQLTSDGQVRAATVNIRIGHGSLRLPALPEAPLEVDTGSINVAYDSVAGKVTLAPSTLNWRGSRIAISGTATAEPGNADNPAWSYQLRASEGSFAAEEFNVPAIALDELVRQRPHPAATAARLSSPTSSCAPAAPRWHCPATSSPVCSPPARGWKAR